jgi:hypothetical protein
MDCGHNLWSLQKTLVVASKKASSRLIKNLGCDRKLVKIATLAGGSGVNLF